MYITMSHLSGLNLYETLIRFTSIISDTYTLIVGFVAIGIPLAIQISGKLSEKYDNPLLSKRLTHGLLITPISLIIISVSYISISLVFKVIVENNSPHYISHYSDTIFIISSILCFLFFTTLLSAGWFYVRLYRRSITKTGSIINSFLMIENTLQLNLIEYVSSKFKIKLLTAFTEKLRFARFTKSNLNCINAGLEVLIEQLENKSWDNEFVDILLSFHKKIILVYFNDSRKKSVPLTELDIEFIKLYWDSLVRIIRISRNTESAKMSFHSQRLLADVVSNIVHHPQYSLLSLEKYGVEDYKGINWTSDVYELARWQGQKTDKGIDLILECEWFSDIFNTGRELNLVSGERGKTSAFGCLKSIFPLIVDEHPAKVISLYKNISNGLYGDAGQPYYFYYPDDKSMRWISGFWDDFNLVEFNIYNLDVLDDLLLSLSDGRAYIKYGTYPESQPLTKDIVAEARRVINFDELYQSIIIKIIKSTGWEFSAYLVFYERWQELYDCLEWRQPKGAVACHTGEAMLASNASELLDLVQYDYRTIVQHYRFYERHEITLYAFRSFLFQLYYFHERNGKVSQLYSSGTLLDSYIQKCILEKLLEQEKYVNKKLFDKKVVKEVGYIIRESILKIEKRDLNDINEKPVINSKWYALRKDIEQGWDENQLLRAVLKIIYVKDILPTRIIVVKSKVSRVYLIDSNEELSGKQLSGGVCMHMIRRVYNDLLCVAIQGTFNDIVINNSLVFAPIDTLRLLGFKRTNGYWIHSDCSLSRAMTCNSEIIIVDCSKFSLILSSNVSSDNGLNPLFTYYIDGSKGGLEICADLYYEITINGGNAVMTIPAQED